MKTLPVILGILLSLNPTTSYAQSTFGVVLGTVKDASGAVVGNAAVRLTNLGENIQRETLTDVNGDYEFLNAKPGNYSVSINRSGFRTFALLLWHAASGSAMIKLARFRRAEGQAVSLRGAPGFRRE